MDVDTGDCEQSQIVPQAGERAGSEWGDVEKDEGLERKMRNRAGVEQNKAGDNRADDQTIPDFRCWGKLLFRVAQTGGSQRQSGERSMTGARMSRFFPGVCRMIHIAYGMTRLRRVGSV